MFIVYETTNLVNNKIYIGVSGTGDPKYLGSGIALNKAFKKYGKENFVRKTLFSFDNYQEAYAKEQEIVNSEFISSSNNYNLRIGGRGGFTVTNKAKKMISNKLTGVKFSEERKTNIKNAISKSGIHDRLRNKKRDKRICDKISNTKNKGTYSLPLYGNFSSCSKAAKAIGCSPTFVLKYCKSANAIPLTIKNLRLKSSYLDEISNSDKYSLIGKTPKELGFGFSLNSGPSQVFLSAS